MSYVQTHNDVLLQLLNGVLPHPIQHAAYLSPAGYSVVFCDNWRVPHRAHQSPRILRSSPCLRSSDTNTTLSHTSWLVGLLWGQHHLLLSGRLRYPCGRLNIRSLHNTSFIVTSAVWWAKALSPGWAGLLRWTVCTALVCEHSSFGRIAALIL